MAASRDRPLPLSPAQLRLWFLDRLMPDSPLYNIPVVYRLKGRLDRAALEGALTEIARRHDVLRTVFTAVEGEPRQIIRDVTPFDLDPIDLRTLPRPERETTSHELAHQEAQRPFDLATGPLIRASLVRLDETDHLLAVTMHHIISDGWSMELFADEMGTLYEAFITGLPPDLPELAEQYADYAVRQRDWLRTSELEEHLAYWKEKLRGMQASIDLPADRPRPSVQSFRGATQGVTVPDRLYSAIGAFSRREGVTPFVPLLSAFMILLSRYTGNEDIVAGTVVTGRNSLELERLIGFFVNTLVVRIDLSGDPSFGKLIGRVHETVMEALFHQNVPFETLVDALEPERDPSRSPLVQVLFALQNKPIPAPRMPGISTRATELWTGTSKFDLTLSLCSAGDSYTGSLEYSTDLFDSSRMQRMQDHYKTILSHAVSNPELPISRLPLLGNDERRLMLVEWNETDRECPQDELVPHLFDAQTATSPDAVAVSFNDEHVTYGELKRRANQLANHLRTGGAGPETCVGICMDKSPMMITGLLGILKAGGAYVPLDPDYPLERLALMCRDARIGMVLTEERHRDEIARSVRSIPGSGSHETEIISLDLEWESIASLDDGTPPTRFTGGNAAYMIYTSGSTGTPKGVLNIHSGLINQIRWFQRAMAVTADDRGLFETRLSFDLSIEEIWPFLTKGASVHILDDITLASPVELARWIINKEISIASLPTPMAEAVMNIPLPANMPLRLLVTGGDILHRGTPRALPFALVNSYGPTENSVVTTWDPDPVPTDTEHQPPIGIPVDNNRVYILDRYGNPVPIGVPGELHVSGSGLARGYFERPALTAERFIPNQFGTAGGERLYRSGDLARYRDDGKIEFLGRLDHQVKIRGFRIELGEIEAVLKSNPTVMEAAAKTWDDETRGKYIAAYVVPRPSGGPSRSDLRRFLGEKLPAYMIPSAIVFLDKLPLSPNNKIDRAALPEPPGLRPELEESYVPPRTETERAVAGIWRELLGVDTVGIHDNFFDLGGHSLLLARVNAKLNTLYDREISMVEMFRHPTIGSLVDYLHRDTEVAGSVVETETRVSARDRLITERRRFRLRQREFANGTVPRHGVGIEDRYPLSPMQQGMLFHSLLGTQPGVYVQQIVCTLEEPCDTPALREAVRRTTARHPALRTGFNLTDPADPYQEVRRRVELPFTEEDWRTLDRAGQRKRLERLCIAERLRGFDLSRSPLARYVLIHMADRKHHFVWTFHHALIDGRSILIILRELFDIYAAITAGERVQLDRPTPYRNYIDWLASQDTGRPERFWREILSGLTTPTPLPAWDVPHAGTLGKTEAGRYVNGVHGAGYAPRRLPAAEPIHGRCERRLSSELTDALTALATEYSVTLNTVVQGAWALLLSRHGGVQDVTFGAVRACRHIPLPDANSIVGVLINALPVRVPVPHGETLGPWLEELRSRWVAMREFEHTPLVTIQGWSEIPAGRPLFDTLLAFENYRFDDALRAEGPSWYNRTIRHVVDTNYPLTVLAFAGRRLQLLIEYDQIRLSRGAANRLLARLETILVQMAANPTRRLREFSVLTDEERRLVIIDWNRTATAFPAERCVHELFTERAAESSDAVAVVSGDAYLTFGELNRRAERLARRLRSLGVGPEVIVAVSLERSPELVIALLAVLKAGGAYLPLDPEYPTERLGFMLDDAGARIIITEPSLRDAIPDKAAVTILIDAWHGEHEERCSEEPSPSATPDTIAYVMYTSGSTGTPKGTAISHRGITRLIFGVDYADLDGEQCILQLASPSFDASTFELWGSLLHGGRCVLPPERIPSPAQLGAMICRYGITTLWLTASLFNAVIDAAPEALSPLGQLLVGGEALSPEHIRRALGILSGTEITNGYGPTEATTFTCCHRIPREVAPSVRSIPIGRPIGNTQVYIVDSLLHPAAIGSPGELYIGGPGLARGYLNRARLTAERFIPDPFGSGSGDRLYRSGDLVRYLADGTIEFIGRLDNQIKIRGYRVEPGEIETVLAAHPKVKEAVVTARVRGAGDRRLLAYIVPSTPQHPEEGELRRFLEAKLPPYMIPGTFITVERFPLTPASKIDRRALPDPERTRPVETAAYVPPHDTIERALAEIWEEILEIDRVGINDNFFELGGNSILAIKVSNKVKNRIGYDIPVADLFRYPLISALTRHIKHETKDK